MVLIEVFCWLGVLLLSVDSALPCLEAYCPRESVWVMQRGNEECDLSCMNAMCGYDKGSKNSSDCLSQCSIGCTVGLGDGICQPSTS
jgi:hypothetical protein